MAFVERMNENLKENVMNIAGKNDNVGFPLLGKANKSKALCDVGNTVNNKEAMSAKKQTFKPFEKINSLQPFQKKCLSMSVKKTPKTPLLNMKPVQKPSLKPVQKTPILSVQKTPILSVQKTPKKMIYNEFDINVDTSDELTRNNWNDFDECSECEADRPIDVYIKPTLTDADIEKLALDPFPRKQQVPLNDSIEFTLDDNFYANIVTLPEFAFKEQSTFALDAFKYVTDLPPPVYDSD